MTEYLWGAVFTSKTALRASLEQARQLKSQYAVEVSCSHQVSLPLSADVLFVRGFQLSVVPQ